MRDFKKNAKGSLGSKENKKNNNKYSESDCTARRDSISLPKEAKKSYRVTITYIQLSAEQTKAKLAIIESIMKKCKKIGIENKGHFN